MKLGNYNVKDVLNKARVGSKNCLNKLPPSVLLHELARLGPTVSITTLKLLK